MADRLDGGRKSNVSNELIASYAIEAEQAQREIDEATNKKRAVLKRAKGSGVNTKALIAAIALKRQDEDTILQDERDRLRYANIIAPGAPLKQEDLFDGLDLRPLNRKASAAMTEWEVEMTGYRAGLDGADKSDNPHTAGSPHHVKWLGGWQRGQLQNADPEGSKVASIDRRKPRGKAAAAGPDDDDDDRQTDLEEMLPANGGPLLDGRPPAGRA